MEDVYIGLINTKQLRKLSVVVIRSTFFHYLDAAIPEIAEEYLAYGKISGIGYRAASLEDIINSNALLDILCRAMAALYKHERGYRGRKTIRQLLRTILRSPNGHYSTIIPRGQGATLLDEHACDLFPTRD